MGAAPRPPTNSHAHLAPNARAPQVPAAPVYLLQNVTSNQVAPLQSLPACSDEFLLLAFKDTFANGASVLADWRPGTDHCKWQGTSCDAAGRVTKM